MWVLPFFGRANSGGGLAEIFRLGGVRVAMGFFAVMGAGGACDRDWRIGVGNRDVEGGRQMSAPKFELWEFTMSVDASGRDGLDAARARWTPTGLDIPETMTLENVKEILRAFKAFETTGTLALADLLNFVKQRGWEKEVEKYMAQLEFDLSSVRRAQAVLEVPRALRNPKLNSEHYWVVSSLEKDEQTRWLALAVKHNLTGFELKRSIEAGKVLKKSDIEMLSGQGSGIINYQGILTNWKRWVNKVGADEGILSWPANVLDRWLEDTKPIADLRERVIAGRAKEAK